MYEFLHDKINKNYFHCKIKTKYRYLPNHLYQIVGKYIKI